MKNLLIMAGVGGVVLLLASKKKAEAAAPGPAVMPPAPKPSPAAPATPAPAPKYPTPFVTAAQANTTSHKTYRLSPGRSYSVRLQVTPAVGAEDGSELEEQVLAHFPGFSLTSFSEQPNTSSVTLQGTVSVERYLSAVPVSIEVGILGHTFQVVGLS